MLKREDWAKEKKIKWRIACLQVARGLVADLVLLDRYILLELLHGDTSYSHGVTNHQTGGRDDVPWGEWEHFEHEEQDHGDRRANQDGHESDILPARDLIRTLASCIASNCHLYVLIKVTSKQCAIVSDFNDWKLTVVQIQHTGISSLQ